MPMPLMGSVAIYLAVVLTIIFSVGRNAISEYGGILAGATLLVVVGILDDRGLLHHQLKLFVAMPAAAALLLASGIRAGIVSTLLPGPAGVILDALLTMLWVVGVTAAFSILDHMDGLCAGIAALASAFFLALAASKGQIPVVVLSGALLGASLGFLFWNFHPARIFMGDGGAMFLGFMIATLGLELRSSGLPPSLNWTTPVLVLAVPIFDTTLVSISRARRGLVPFSSPGKDHTAHRLANWGLGTRGAVLVLYGLACICGFFALELNRLPVAPSLALAVLFMAAAILAVLVLERAPYERQAVGRPLQAAPDFSPPQPKIPEKLQRRAAEARPTSCT